MISLEQERKNGKMERKSEKRRFIRIIKGLQTCIEGSP